MHNTNQLHTAFSAVPQGATIAASAVHSYYCAVCNMAE